MRSELQTTAWPLATRVMRPIALLASPCVKFSQIRRRHGHRVDSGDDRSLILSRMGKLAGPMMLGDVMEVRPEDVIDAPNVFPAEAPTKITS